MSQSGPIKMHVSITVDLNYNNYLSGTRTKIKSIFAIQLLNVYFKAMNEL